MKPSSSLLSQEILRSDRRRFASPLNRDARGRHQHPGPSGSCIILCRNKRQNSVLQVLSRLSHIYEYCLHVWGLQRCQFFSFYQLNFSETSRLYLLGNHSLHMSLIRQETQSAKSPAQFQGRSPTRQGLGTPPMVSVLGLEQNTQTLGAYLTSNWLVF